MNDNLKIKLNKKTAIIGIIGLGYVGLPLLIRYSEEGYKVIGFDIDKGKVDSLNNSKSYIKHIDELQISLAIDCGFEATNDFSRINEVDAIILCLPTPLKENRSPDLSYVLDSFEQFKIYLKDDQVISLESTTYPGTTEEELLPRINSLGFEIGRNFFLVYSPEREDPSNEDFNTKNIPKIVSGITDSCLEVGLSLYTSIIDQVIPVSSVKVAEMAKLLENIYRAVNIGMINEMKIVADVMNIDIFEVIEAASTKPFGFKAFYPGPGLGGHCIPIDPFYLTWKAKEYGIDSRFIELSGEVNRYMPKWVIEKVKKSLEQVNKRISDSKILVLGLAYKKNLDDVRESPSIEILSLLKDQGALVDYSDPYIPEFPKMRKYDFNLSSVDLSESNIGNYDLVLLATDHDNFDYGLILRNSKILIDTRGVYREESSNLVKA